MSDNPEDFDQFFRREFGPLVAFVRKLGFELEEAKEAAAEAMTCAYRCWHKLDSPRAWIRTVAKRFAERQRNRRREDTIRATAAHVGVQCDGTDKLNEVDERLRLLSVLAVLPPNQREVIALSLDGCGTTEIARRKGISEATVRSHMRHARNRLKQELEATGGWFDERHRKGVSGDGRH